MAKSSWIPRNVPTANRGWRQKIRLNRENPVLLWRVAQGVERMISSDYFLKFSGYRTSVTGFD